MVSGSGSRSPSPSAPCSSSPSCRSPRTSWPRGISSGSGNGPRSGRPSWTRGWSRDSLLTTNDPRTALGALEFAQNSAAAISREGQWYASAPAAQPEAIPIGLRREALAGAPVRQRYDALGTPRITTAVPLPAVNATYFEVARLVELRSTLDVLRNVLIGTSIATTIAATFVGTWAGRRVLRPVGDVSRVAATIAGGDLAARLTARRSGSRPRRRVVQRDGRRVAGSDRSRHARFVSDVSHELRSPLTTLATTADILERRRDELPARLQQPIDLLVAEIGHFRVVVEDLLELSKAESGTDPLLLEPVWLGELVRQCVRRSAPKAMVQVDNATAESPLLCDKRRIERALTNLIVNAETHGGGLERVMVERDGEVAKITLDDSGPGVPVEDRERVFERFYRGQKSGRARQQWRCGTRPCARRRARAHPWWERADRESPGKARNACGHGGPVARRLMRVRAGRVARGDEHAVVGVRCPDGVGTDADRPSRCSVRSPAGTVVADADVDRAVHDGVTRRCRRVRKKAPRGRT